MKQIEYNEDDLPIQIAASNLKAFEYLFRLRYEELYNYVAKITTQQAIAEEIVQDVFVSLWERRDKTNITGNITSYLYRAVKNKAIDYLRSQHAQVQKQFIDETAATQISESPSDNLEVSELSVLIQQGIDSLPEQCKKIFLLSREGGLTYSEIADALSVSPKTVKAQVAIALKKMRDFLDGHLDKIIVLIISYLQNI